MKELVDFIKNKCSQEEIQELVKELSAKEETKENDVPTSWEDYIKSCRHTTKFYIDTFSVITPKWNFTNADENKNTLPSKELAEAFLVMMQLMSLRQAWIKNWEPNWEDESEYKYCIAFARNSFEVLMLSSTQKNLSFPTEKMAEDFLECFRDLINKSKILI